MKWVFGPERFPGRSRNGPHGSLLVELSFLYFKLSLAKERSVPSQEVATSGKPVYSAEEVAEHNTREKRIWVTYKDNVYDITDFIDSHPGGSKKIILAAGKPLEPFWALYAVHNTQHILDLLEEYHIGTLSVDKASSQSTDIKVKCILQLVVLYDEEVRSSFSHFTVILKLEKKPN